MPPKLSEAIERMCRKVRRGRREPEELHKVSQPSRMPAGVREKPRSGRWGLAQHRETHRESTEPRRSPREHDEVGEGPTSHVGTLERSVGLIGTLEKVVGCCRSTVEM